MRYLGGAERDQLDPILDACVAVYKRELKEDGRVGFKGKAKGFVRTYSFLSCVLPYANADWEKRSIFLNFLVPKLPAPEEDDLSKGILEAIDLDSYRAEKHAMQKIMLSDEDAEIDPVPTTGGGYIPEPAMDRLSSGSSTISSATLPGKTPTACANSSRRAFPPAWPRTPPSGTPNRTRTSRMPASSTTRLWCES